MDGNRRTPARALSKPFQGHNRAWICSAVVLFIGSGLSSCTDGPTLSEGPPTCEQPDDDAQGISACAFVTGRVTSPSGEPLPNVRVGPALAPPDAGWYYSTPSDDTDSDGRYRLIIHRVFPFTPPNKPDTLTFQLSAYRPSRTRFNPPLPVVQTERVRLEFVQRGRPLIEASRDCMLAIEP